MKKILGFIWEIQNLRIFVILLIFINLGHSILVYSSAEVLSRFVSLIEQSLLEYFEDVIVFAVITSLLLIMLMIASRILTQYLINKSSEKIETKMLSHLYRIPKQIRLEIGFGEFLNKITNNTASAVEGSYGFLSRLSTGFFTMLFGCIYMLMLNPILAVLFFLYSIIFRLSTKIYDDKIKKISEENIHIRNRNNLFLTEILKNSVMIRVFHVFPFFLSRYSKYESDEQENNLKLFMLQNSYDELTWGSKKLMEIIIPFGVGALLMVRGYITFAEIIAFTVANEFYFRGFNDLINTVIQANTTLPHIEAINSFLSKESETTEPKRNTENRLALSFDSVSFKYNNTSIFKNVSFSVKHGEWVKIIGPNGHGKSTLLQLIAGFYKPTSGNISYNGQFPVYIPQFPEMVPADVYGNIALKESPDLKHCELILGSLQMETVARDAPEQYSQGEKQRLMIGRGIYHLADLSIVLADEIFANVDKENRTVVEKYLMKNCNNKTIFFVCHEDTNMPFDVTLHVEAKSVRVVS